MGLINLKTDLKSLKYGKDRKGGGDSGQPYIKSDIPDGLTSSSPDFLLRNGYLNPVSTVNDVSRLTQMFFDLKSPNGLLFIAKQNLLSRTAVATQTSGKGLNEGVYTPTNTLAQAGVNSLGLHLNKQGINPFELTGTYSNNNNLYDVRIKNYNQEWLLSPDGNLKNRLYALYDSKIQNNEIGGFAKTNNISNFSTEILTYNGGPGSNLGIGNTSIKFADQRTGINNPLVISNPSYFTGSYKPVFEPGNYLKNINFSKGASNAYYISSSVLLTSPYNTEGVLNYNFSVSNPTSSYKPVFKPGNYLKTLYNVKLNNGAFGKYSRLIGLNQSDYNTLQPYNPQGVLNYNFSVYNSWPKNNLPKPPESIFPNNTFTYTQQNIISTENNVGKLNGSPKSQDFRAILRGKLQGTQKENATKNGATPISPNYTSSNIENRVLLGDPGSRANKNYSSYTNGVINTTNGKKVGPLDKINALPIYRSQWVTPEDDLKNDLVKFRIAAIDNDDPNFKNFMHFRAFLDSFSDAYTGDWGSTKYLGRGENFYNYTGFNRTISLSWTVAAQSKEELIPMYKKLNYLASNLMPDYSKSGYMRGPLMQMTVGGYLYEQVGFFTSLNYEIPAESPWEIGINDTGGEDGTVKELSHMIKVQASFTPIHDFVPSKQDLQFDDQLNATINDKDGKPIIVTKGFVNGYGQQRFIALAVGSGSQYNNYDASSAYQVGNGKYTVT